GGTSGQGDPGRQGSRPGRRLPRRWHDDRRRGRRPVHRSRAPGDGHPRPPDGGRTDDLRPATNGVTTAAARGALDAVVVAAGGSRRMAGSDKLMAQIGGRPLLAWTLERLAAAPEIDRIVVGQATDP